MRVPNIVKKKKCRDLKPGGLGERYRLPQPKREVPDAVAPAAATDNDLELFPFCKGKPSGRGKQFISPTFPPTPGFCIEPTLKATNFHRRNFC